MWLTSENKYSETELRKIMKALILYHNEICDYEEEEQEIENIICKISQELKGDK